METLQFFNGQTQLSIKRARKVSEESVDPSNYLPCTDKNMDEMMTELLKFIASVNNPYYKQILTTLFVEDANFAEAFKKHSAAKSVHHGIYRWFIRAYTFSNKVVRFLYKNNILF